MQLKTLLYWQPLEGDLNDRISWEWNLQCLHKSCKAELCFQSHRKKMLLAAMMRSPLRGEGNKAHQSRAGSINYFHLFQGLSVPLLCARQLAHRRGHREDIVPCHTFLKELGPSGVTWAERNRLLRELRILQRSTLYSPIWGAIWFYSQYPSHV